MSEEGENYAAIQRATVEKFKTAREKKQLRLSKDIREEIAQGSHYNPKDDPIYEYQPYPKWVTPEGGKPQIVHSKAEHDALLGLKPEPAKAKTVDVSALVQTPEAAPVRRGRPPKAAVQPLPAALE